MKHLKSTKSRVILSLAFLIVLIGLIPTLGIFSGGRQSAIASAITEYNIPSGSNSIGITSGPDGNLWFAEHTIAKIGKITTNGTITEYDVPNGASPYGITSGPDGNLWFTEEGGDTIDKITTNGTVTKYFIPSLSSPYPYAITSGPDGNLWFTEAAANKIGKITTGGTITEYNIPTLNGEPEGITSGPDGNLWFTEAAANKIGKITPSGMFTEYAVPNNTSIPGSPVSITSGPDGNLWFTNNDTIGKITPLGNFTAYTIPNNGSALAITSGPDGNLWFSDAGNRIWKITTSGTFTGYDIPDNSTLEIYPQGLTFGPDGNLWFSEYDYSKIGVLHLSGVTPSPTPTQIPTVTPTPSPSAAFSPYVALGDSYSSGEGAPDPTFMFGTDQVNYNLCHRSVAAYPEVVYNTFANKYPWFFFKACSGAKIQDFYAANQEGNSGEPAQLSWLNQHTRLVTLTIGGNDVDFHDVLQYCATRPAVGSQTCKAKFDQIVNSEIAAISSTNPNNSNTLAYLYKLIKKDAPNAKVLVVGYPRLFPVKPPHFCLTGAPQLSRLDVGSPAFFIRSDMDWFNREGFILDAAIERITNYEKKQGGDFTYVNTYNALNGHELCTGDPYINRAIIDTTSIDLEKLVSWSFHPKILGQRAIASCIIPWLPK